MKKQKLLNNLKHRLGLLLCLMAFLTVCQGAWGEKLYLLHGTANDQYASYTSIAEDDNGSTFVFELSGWDHFIYLCKTNTYGSGNVITPGEGDHYKKGSGIQTFQRTNYSTFYMMYIKPDNGNITQTYTLTYNSSNGDYNLSIGGSPTTCTYYMKHNWNNGGWTWKLLQYSDGVYSIDENYGSVHTNINTTASDTGRGDYSSSPSGNPSAGDLCTFTYIPSTTSGCPVTGGTVTITKKPTTTTWTLSSSGFGNETFSGEGNTLTCTKNITAGTYAQDASHGFKIVKNDGSAHNYGANTTMTRENNTYTFGTSGGYCGLNADLTGNYTFTITNLTGNPELTITYPSQTYSIARWGAAPTIDNVSKNINASAYVATHGCNGSSDYTVTQLKVRYWKEGDEANSEVKETATGTYVPGTAYGIEILSNESNVLMNCTTESKIIMEVACKNGLGWSAYSDRMAVMYTAGTTFVTENLTKSFTACEGSHQFTLSEMVKPVPDSWTVTSGGTNSDFTLADGEMVWNPGDKTTGQYVYDFTFKKAGYEVDGTATLTINYTKTAPEGAVTISASKTAATKYEEVTLTATKGTGVEKIKWSVTPDTYITTTNADGTNATFQGKAIKTYTVTAVGLSESCGEKAAPESITINVSKDTEECNE